MGKKTGRNPTDRGKQGTKRSLLVDAAGIPLSVFTEAANVHDVCLVGANLLELDDLPVKRPSPRRTQQGMCMDKAYDSASIRKLVAQYGFTPHIRSRGEEKRRRKARDASPSRPSPPTLGGGTNTQLVQLFSRPTHPLVQERTKPHRPSPPRVSNHNRPPNWVIRIGSKSAIPSGRDSPRGLATFDGVVWFGFSEGMGPSAIR